jgi:single-strand DNA-binding protein
MLNKATLIGRSGNDPTVRYGSDGSSVASVSLATSERWNDKQSGEKKEATEWHRLVFFGKLAEIVSQYVVKGSLIYVEGAIHTKKWTDKSGIDKYTTEIVCSTMKMLGEKGSHSESVDKVVAGDGSREPSDNDDVPF